jgi:hypothetical protein
MEGTGRKSSEQVWTRVRPIDREGRMLTKVLGVKEGYTLGYLIARIPDKPVREEG